MVKSISENGPFGRGGGGGRAGGRAGERGAAAADDDVLDDDAAAAAAAGRRCRRGMRGRLGSEVSEYDPAALAPVPRVAAASTSGKPPDTGGAESHWNSVPQRQQVI